ncbi:NACHT ankyrin domain-containing protein [Fusarium heterosporum]|uniref:NACHT ankyrin domain-containing protein n=1 Tax=Fusarium heterosporum TaxID=42747 RepID=A0A8H5WDP4_FUSHE|nr:NACHT ankyrin domain-containing protein [Fusarium heterosporum]
MKWPFESEEIDRITLDFCKFRDALSACLSIDQMALVMQSLEKVEVDERIKILNWISSVPHGKHHNTIEEARTLGTCEWILQDPRCQEWEHCSAPMLLWLQGSPGTGKTFLTSKIVDHIRNEAKRFPARERLAFFYCNRNEEDRRKPVSVLRSWIRQLSTTTGGIERLPTKLRVLYHQAINEASDLKFQVYKDYLLELTQLYPRTTLVLDALDECDSDARGRLIGVIEFLLTRSTNVLRVFVSSRPDGDTQQRFLSRHYIEIQATNNQHDVATFVKTQIVAHRHWGNMSQSLQKRIQNTIIGNSNGMFQWASLQVKQLLELFTEAAIVDRLGKLPQDLKTTYDEIYNKIRARNRYDKALADRAFMLVMCSPVPLDSFELLSAIRLDSDPNNLLLSEAVNEDLLRDICNDLLVLDNEERVWRFSHLSVIEYLEEHHYSLDRAHCNVAIICLRLLTDSYVESDTEQPTEIFHPKSPFQSYCREYWIYHVQAQKTEQPSVQVMNLLKLFLGSPQESSIHYQRWFFLSKQRLTVSMGLEFAHMSPATASLFGVIRLSLAGLLWDWWDNADIPLTTTNATGNDLLTIAALSGCTATCEGLIKRGFAVNPLRKEYTNSLFSTIISIVGIGVPQHQNNAGHGRTESGPLVSYGHCLIAAADSGYLDVVKYLLTQGADVSHSGGFYGTALVAAAWHGYKNIVEFLLDNGADVNQRTEHRGSALTMAATWGRIDVVKLLLDKGANIHGSDCASRVLEFAAKREFPAVIQLLFRLAESNHITGLGLWTQLIETIIASRCAWCLDLALVAAADRGSERSINLLIEHGAEVNSRSTTGSPTLCCCSALAEAAYRGHAKAIKLLIKHGADVNLHLRDGIDRTALGAAARSGQTWIVKFLVRQGAKVYLPLQRNFKNAIEWAACCRDVRMIKFLVNQDAGVVKAHRAEILTKALYFAIDKANVKAVKFLIKQGADMKQAGCTCTKSELIDIVKCRSEEKVWMSPAWERAGPIAPHWWFVRHEHPLERSTSNT